VRVGIAYDLREDYLKEGFTAEQSAEFDAPETIDAIEQALDAMGYQPVRIGNVRRLVARLAEGERWDLVFNIAEGLSGLGREAQVPGLLEAYGIPYTFSDPLALCLTLHKAMAKRVVRDCGQPTADFRVIEREADIRALDLEPPLFVKPVAEGTGKGVSAASRIEDLGQLAPACRRLLAQFRQPVLVERFLPGREFTVGIVGTGEGARSIGVMEILLGPESDQEGYTFLNKEHYEERVSYRLVEDAAARQAEAVALGAWRCLGCRDGGRVDLRADRDGRPQFLEVNPLAGLHPRRSDLVILARLAGLPFQELIAAIMASAHQRLALPAQPHGGGVPRRRSVAGA
jgi:D-alanine-D-alanine ligase